MLVDILIVLVAIVAVLRSWQSGFVRQFCASVGFFGGLFLGRWLETYTITLVHSPPSRTLVTIVTVLGLALCCLVIGETIGMSLKYHLVGKKLNKLDNSLGGILSVASVLIAAWLLTAVANSLPPSTLSRSLNQSKIISGINHILPPAPTVIADLGKLINPNGFPNVFIGTEPIPKSNINLPALGNMAAAVSTDRASVVRVQGDGCGGVVSGSGFVVGNDLIATNAHVVAGIEQPVVEDENGVHSARVIWFDPNLDFALLRVSNLVDHPLSLNATNQPSGTPAVVLGYPGGGPFSAAPAAIMNEFEATGQNIYDNGMTVRSVYEIKGTVIPGNSGGPLVAQNGTVIGVVFAESTTYNQVGYALSMGKVIGEINKEKNNIQTVSTGACAE